jgi:hypothetical protein
MLEQSQHFVGALFGRDDVDEIPIQRVMQGNAFGLDPTELEPARINVGFYLASPGDGTHFGFKSRAGSDRLAAHPCLPLTLAAL